MGSVVELGKDGGFDANRFGAPPAGVEAENKGAAGAALGGSAFFSASAGVLGLGAKRLPKGPPAGAGAGLGSSFSCVAAGLGANKLPKGFPSGAFGVLCSVVAAGLGANRLPAPAGWEAPNAGFSPNNPPDAGAGAALALFEKSEAPPVLVAPNWNGVVEAGSLAFFSSCSFSWGVFDAAGAPEKRFVDWKGFWKGVAGLSAGLAPKRFGVEAEGAGAGVDAAGVAEVDCVVAPKSGVAGVACSAGFAPKRGLEGVCSVEAADFASELRPPNTGGAAAGVPLPKMEGFDAAAAPFASGDVCIESSPKAVDCPNAEGLLVLDWPKILGEGAALEAAGCPNIPAVAVGVAAAGCEDAGVEELPNIPPVVLFWPKSPVEGKACWAGAWLPVGGRLNIFPLKPEKPLVSSCWLGAPVLMLAKGLLGAGPEPNEGEAKLNEDEPPPPPLPPPNENGDDVPFCVGWLGAELAPGKL